MTPKWLVDAGFTTNIIHYSVVYQPGQEKVTKTPEWFAGASHVDQVLNIRTNSSGVQSFFLPDRRGVSSSMAYVTGSHTIRAGIQDGWGKNDRVSSINADLVQNYQNAVPVSVTVYNTPLASRVRVDADLALCAEDKKTSKRHASRDAGRGADMRSLVRP